MYTTLITLDNRRVIIPNSTITASNIINFNAENMRRIDLIYSVSYDTDIEKAREALIAVAKRNDLIAENPAPLIGVNEHSSSSINLVCMVWCKSNNYWPVFFYMQEEVKKEFDARGIKIPYNQLDVHISENK
jgi:small conductance mechanosensitive channel